MKYLKLIVGIIIVALLFVAVFIITYAHTTLKPSADDQIQVIEGCGIIRDNYRFNEDGKRTLELTKEEMDQVLVKTAGTRTKPLTNICQPACSQDIILSVGFQCSTMP